MMYYITVTVLLFFFLASSEVHFKCLCAELTLENCASPVQWFSPSRRLTTARSCCQASNLVIRSMTHAPQCLWQWMWHFNFPMGWTRCFTLVTIARKLVW